MQHEDSGNRFPSRHFRQPSATVSKCPPREGVVLVLLKVVVPALLVAFVIFKGWRGPFPWEEHHWQRRREKPPGSAGRPARSRPRTARRRPGPRRQDQGHHRRWHFKDLQQLKRAREEQIAAGPPGADPDLPGRQTAPPGDTSSACTRAQNGDGEPCGSPGSG